LPASLLLLSSYLSPVSLLPLILRFPVSSDPPLLLSFSHSTVFFVLSSVLISYTSHGGKRPFIVVHSVICQKSTNCTNAENSTSRQQIVNVCFRICLGLHLAVI
jgi:hypothetical protein